MDKELVDDVEAHLREVHEKTTKIAEWAEDSDLFVRDLMELATSAFSNGYMTAIEDTIKALTNVFTEAE